MSTPSIGSAGGTSSAYGTESTSATRSTSTTSLFTEGSFSFSTVVEEGALVRQRQELIKIPDLSQMLAEVKIQEARVRQLRPGMLAFVKVESIPDRRFEGRVRKVAILPDSQTSWMSPDVKVYSTEVQLEGELPQLKPGVSARAEIIITNLQQVLSVPIQSVGVFQGKQVCYVAKGTENVPVPVATGWFNDRFIEITSGLKDGDRILLAPPPDTESDLPEPAGEGAEKPTVGPNGSLSPADRRPAAPSMVPATPN